MKIKALGLSSSRQRPFQWGMVLLTYILVGQLGVNTVDAWSNEEFEMFDLVEEVGQNFYELMGIAQDAGDKEIRKAYRQLSVKLHPDKNPAEDAEVKFRQMVGVYEVLKNKDLRESYDRVLVDGLPNWRQPMFYFRRARRFALWQVALIVLSIVSLGQYLAGWASYFEKRLSMKEQIEARLRKTQRTKRGQKEGQSLQEELEAEMEKYLPKPSLWNLAPFQILRGIKYLVLQFPKDVLAYHEELKLKKEEELRLAAEEQERLEKERQKAEEPKKPRRKKTFQPPELPEGQEAAPQPVWSAAENPEQQGKKSSKPPVISGGLWTDDDIAELARLCSKFPGGTPERWEKIADLLNRPVPEVTFMAKKVLEKLATKPGEEEVPVVPQVKSKVKTKGGKADAILAGGPAQTDSKSVENWSAEEQKALEHALQCYPKGAIERWDKIAKMVPNRSKEECMQRFKYVAELVKKKKEKDVEPSEKEEPAAPEEPKVAEPEPVKPTVDKQAPPSDSLSEEPGWEEPRKSKKAARKARARAEAELEPLESEDFQAEPIEPPSSSPPEPAKPTIQEPEPEKPAKSPVEPEPVKVESPKKKKAKQPPSPKKRDTTTPSKVEEKILTPVQVAQNPGKVEKTCEKLSSQSSSVPPSKASQQSALVPDEVVVPEETIESQLESLVEESFRQPKEVGEEEEKESVVKVPVHRTDSKSSSEGSEPIIIIPEGERDTSSQERSVERKNSSSSENDWCVVESDVVVGN